MAIAPSTDWQGLLDLHNLSTFIVDVKDGGYESKLTGVDKDKFNELKEIGKELNFVTIPDYSGISQYLTPSAITTLVSQINAISLPKLTDFKNMLKADSDLVKGLKSNFESYKAVPNLAPFLSRVATTAIPTVTNIQSVINTYTNVNIGNLANPATSINFLHDLSILDQATYNNLLKTIKGDQLEKLITELPGMTAITEVTGLTPANISSFINVAATQASNCICTAFGMDVGFETLLNNFLSNILPTFDLTKLLASKAAFNAMIAKLDLELSAELLKLSHIDNLLSALDTFITLITGLGIPPACLGIFALLKSMLLGLKALFTALVITPLLGQINGLALQVNQIIDFANLLGNLTKMKADFTC